jgi:hypothetical protein
MSGLVGVIDGPSNADGHYRQIPDCAAVGEAMLTDATDGRGGGAVAVGGNWMARRRSSRASDH